MFKVVLFKVCESADRQRYHKLPVFFPRSLGWATSWGKLNPLKSPQGWVRRVNICWISNLKPASGEWRCCVFFLPGRDCLGCAKTGSGKTAAFVLPVLQKLSEDPYGIFCLVLTPTRSVLCSVREQTGRHHYTFTLKTFTKNMFRNQLWFNVSFISYWTFFLRLHCWTCQIVSFPDIPTHDSKVRQE